ncbi:hypothetical protein fh0823_04810 [Francisella halioticida]|uniref:hypothetical protein n=1 Tax=Francisella halioticida TaxID=549298 RepID=UPI001AFA7D85|nr:hypothetical protein fh0823_04810 [Francisella halioticida]
MKSKGFLIVELIVIIAIIAIIVAIAMPMYSNYQTRAKISNADIQARIYINEIALYSHEKGYFPEENSDLWGC